MKKGLKRKIGDFAINFGKRAVGKCIIPGMFDPKIPSELKKQKDRIDTSSKDYQRKRDVRNTYSG